jgi:hypothetical protein
MTTITFHTGDVPEDLLSSMVIIDANNTEKGIVKETRIALNNTCDESLPIAKPNIFSFSELALTTARVWCEKNEMSIRIYNWCNGTPIISTIDTRGRIDGEYPFNKNIELLTELM